MDFYLIGSPGGFEVIILLYVGILALPIAALISILSNAFPDNTQKLIWVIVVIFIPILGSIIYFIIGRRQQLRFQNKTQ